jgi:ubiquinone/menaquinone biosynthesis C-methylase UbiE
MNFSLDFEKIDTDAYLDMLVKEHRLGTNDYNMHNRNSDYWDILLKPAKNPEYKIALDFGTGLGRNVRNLIGLGNFDEIYATDLSEKNISKCQSSFPSNCHFILSDGRKTPYFENNKFDFIISTLVFQHIPVREIRNMWFKEIYRVLKPGGTFTFQMGFGDTMGERAYPHHLFCLLRTGTLTRPSLLECASYFENITNAIGSSGEFDVKLTKANPLVDDLTRFGFKVDYQIKKSFDDYIHLKWIYVTCTK